MSTLRATVGWVVRGGDQTRADLAEKTAAIQALQQRLADLDQIDQLRAEAERDRAEARAIADDLARRLTEAVSRLDRLEALVDDHDTQVTSLARQVAPPSAE